jgi:hypothetical protein
LVDKPPAFFVPDIPADDQEAAYVQMAEFGRCAVPPIGERIYSIIFTHDGIEWTATVGRHMQGVRGEWKRSRGQKAWKETPVFDATTIAAIFPGHPYTIFHTGGRSPWQNPFISSHVKSSTRFSAD